MSNDSRDLINKFRSYKKNILQINENNEENQLTPQEVQSEISEFKKAVGGISTFNSITKTGNNFLFMRGQIKIGDNQIEFNFKLDECTMSTQNLTINEESIKVINQLNGYYITWIQRWQSNLSSN